MSRDTAVALVPEVTSDEIKALTSVLGVKDHTPAELTLFALTAKRLGLDPFARQIYSIKRGGRQTIQVSIDGLRSIADRTGQYAGQDEPVYGQTKDGHPEFATVRVLKLIGGQIVGTAATAYWSEFAITGTGGDMWKRMPHVMLAKCAEAQALRKAFPSQLSGVYTDDEMGQADLPTAQRTDVDRTTGEVLSTRQIAPPSDADVADLHARFAPKPADAPFTEDELADVAGGMTTQELFAAAEAADVPKAMLTLNAKSLFGANRWKITDLTDEERAQLWAEVAPVPA